MKPGAAIFEVFPYKYFKPSYMKLAATYGLHHRWTQNTEPTSWNRVSLSLISQESCMKSRRCRSYARGDTVSMNQDHIMAVVEFAREIENGTIGVHNAPYQFKQR